MEGDQCLVVDNGGFSSILSTYARVPGRGPQGPLHSNPPAPLTLKPLSQDSQGLLVPDQLTFASLGVLDFSWVWLC